MIKLQHVTKTFSTDAGPLDAVADVSLEIAAGEIFGIIGFSGAGKSTLVRCINLLERPTSGEVTVDGTELCSLPLPELRAVRRKIGMIFQGFNLMPSRTVGENIALALRHSPMDDKAKAAKIAELLALVGIPEKAGAYPSELSGGQKQRVAIARALANDPKVLLCDEATSALDPQTTQAILKLLKEVNRRLGITIVVITHQMSVVKEICTRVAVMEGGRVVEVAPIDDIFSQPSAELTKSFINTANNVNKFLELAGEGQFEGMLRPGGKLLLLTFKGLDKAGRPFTMHLHDRYGVEPNIVYGNIDFVNGTALGKLGVAVNGEPAAVAAAVAALRAMGISVEEVR